MSHVTHVNELPTSLSHMWKSHVAHVNESCHTSEWKPHRSPATPCYESWYKRVMSRMWMSSWYKWVMSHMWMSPVTHVIYNESCRTCEWVMSHMSFIAANKSRFRHHLHDSLIDSRKCVISRMWMSHVTHVNESRHTCERVMSLIWMSRVTRMNVM